MTGKHFKKVINLVFCYTCKESIFIGRTANSGACFRVSTAGLLAVLGLLPPQQV